MLDATTRVAIAAFLHDLGKLAERARIDENINDIDGNKTTYCPKTPIDQGGRHTHVHAAYTGLAWDQLENTGHFPKLKKNCSPFMESEADGNLTDSAVNAAAAHHRPETFLQWVIATADRVASGFERDEFDVKYNTCRERNDKDPQRDNHYRARLLTLFEQIGKGEIEEGTLTWRYPLKPLSPLTMFPKQDRADTQRAQEPLRGKSAPTKEIQHATVGANSFAHDKTSNCTPANDKDAQAEYRVLWDALLAGLKQIPKSHCNNLPLWLDHLDALWLTITHAIPAATAFGVKPEVSLYDHSKVTAALATALWRWHRDDDNQPETIDSLKGGWDKPKFLLVQGDFFGIQNFIFAQGGQTNKHAHKLLRGRSFQVALLAECAALKLLEALELPPTSQIINAAGKFLIVAPNTIAAKDTVARVRKEFNDWCLLHTYGEIGIGLATTPATCNDFSHGKFGALQKKLFEELDKAKHRRFDLCESTRSPVFENFLGKFNNLGVCEINGRYPAEIGKSEKRPYERCKLADDQISIGEALTQKARVLITKDTSSLPNLSLDYFGWRVAFVPEAELSGKYGQLANDGKLKRCWDFDLPEADGTVFRGYARRFVNTYVPRWNGDDRAQKAHGKYGRFSEDDIGEYNGDQIKTLHVLAAEDGSDKDNQDKWRGEIALLTLKGDVDNLGALFQHGLEKPTFAKWASLSRQVNLFFALWLPWFCEHGSLPSPASGITSRLPGILGLSGMASSSIRVAGGEGNTTPFRNTYTVFAGGDDFFLIGPWRSTIELAGAMQQHFAEYVTKNNITFSAGMVMTQPKVPARQLARAAEAALEKSKDYSAGANSPRRGSCALGVFAQHGENRSKEFEPTKNAASLWNQTVSWADWHTLMHSRTEALQRLLEQAESHDAPLSTGMIYSLLQLADKAEREKTGKYPEDSLWRSQLAYRTSRFITDRVRANGDEDIKTIRRDLFNKVNNELASALVEHRGAYRLPLSVLLYGKRE